jgi:aspartyl protease family protein
LTNQYNPNQTIQSQHSNQKIEITLKRNRLGHYVGNGFINYQPITFFVDTGATHVAIPEMIATQLALKKGRSIHVITANGQTIGYQTVIDTLSIGDIYLSNISAVITPQLDEILLGMSALKQIEFSQQGKILTLRQHL